MNRIEPSTAAGGHDTPSLSPWNRERAILAVLLAVAALIVNLHLALDLGRFGVLDQYDVLFHADPGARLDCAVRNDCAGRSSFAHPGLALFLNPPIQGAAALLARAGIWGGDAENARRTLSIVLSPVLSGVKTWLIFFLLVYVGLSTWRAVLLTILGIVSFSQLVFGSIPDSFAFSGVLLVGVFLLGVRTMRSGDTGFLPWLALGVLVAGVTLSNIVIEAIVFVAAMMQCGVRRKRVILLAAVLVGSALVSSAVLGEISRRIYGLSEMGPSGGADYVTRWIDKEKALDRALEMPVTLAHTFAAPVPEVVRNRHASRTRSRFRFRFTLEPERFYRCREPLSILLMVLLAAGAYMLYRAGGMARALFAASAGIVGFNWILHAFWGTDLFLYSQHWQPALVLMAAGPLLGRRPAPARAAAVVIVLLVAAVAIQNAVTFSSMFQQLRTALPIEFPRG